MSDGTTKPIEQIHTGDYVLARNQQSGALEQKRVGATISRKAPVLVTITLEDVKTGQTETYTATPEHPFYVDSKGWLTAGTLTKGTAIATRSGQALIVKSVVWQRDEEKGFSVYNMTVEDDHDYLAGTLGGGVWVHNLDCDLKEPLDPWPYEKNPLSRPIGPDTPPGNYVYVRDADGVVHIAPDGPHMHPTVLGNGQPATGAGTLTVGPNGTITSIDNASGTFQFGQDTVSGAADAIGGQGVPVNPGAIRGFDW